MKQRPEPLAPGCIGRLAAVLDRIEQAGDLQFLRRAILLLRTCGYETACDLLLAQDGVMLLLRERKLVRRLLKKFCCATDGCSAVGVYVDCDVTPPSYYCRNHADNLDERLSFADELEALWEIERSEDRGERDKRR